MSHDLTRDDRGPDPRLSQIPKLIIERIRGLHRSRAFERTCRASRDGWVVPGEAHDEEHVDEHERDHGDKRDRVQEAMTESGIGTRLRLTGPAEEGVSKLCPPLHQEPPSI
jgi:hypothetical protein